MYLYIFVAILFIFPLGLILFMWDKAYRDRIDYRTVKKNGMLSKSFTIFFISDIHKRLIKENTINKVTERIDAIIIGGDLLEKGVPLEQVKENISLLQSFNAPIYFIWGNNDYEVNVDKLTKLLGENQVKILKDETANIEHAQSTISLIGIDMFQDGELDIESCLSYATGEYNILLTHDPRAVYHLTESEINQIDLVLSGHTHGGQIRIFGLGLYTRGGWKMYKGTPVMISEGYGYTKLPFRLGTNAECHVIKVK